MKKILFYIAIFLIWLAALTFCCFSNNGYINAIVVFLGFGIILMFGSYILDHYNIDLN